MGGLSELFCCKTVVRSLDAAGMTTLAEPVLSWKQTNILNRLEPRTLCPERQTIKPVLQFNQTHFYATFLQVLRKKFITTFRPIWVNACWRQLIEAVLCLTCRVKYSLWYYFIITDLSKRVGMPVPIFVLKAVNSALCRVFVIHSQMSSGTCSWNFKIVS